ncbi:hypothetical protein CWM47_35880 [Spirosoma pollinicola]|uniref:Uncharacterized protein n=1 Tax=Spirosoma pollinicola TaxID=2057025 RepID=A0A2K8ZA58_9BACT|nr:hypothetical protein CWM47_35880 [Spirosoma pollinicola]
MISIRTRQALEARRNRLGEWRIGGPNKKKAAASVLGVRVNKEMAADNDNNRWALSIAEMMHKAGKISSKVAQQALCRIACAITHWSVQSANRA